MRGRFKTEIEETAGKSNQYFVLRVKFVCDTILKRAAVDWVVLNNTKNSIGSKGRVLKLTQRRQYLGRPWPNEVKTNPALMENVRRRNALRERILSLQLIRIGPMLTIGDFLHFAIVLVNHCRTRRDPDAGRC